MGDVLGGMAVSQSRHYSSLSPTLDVHWMCAGLQNSVILLCLPRS